MRISVAEVQEQLSAALGEPLANITDHRKHGRRARGEFADLYPDTEVVEGGEGFFDALVEEFRFGGGRRGSRGYGTPAELIYDVVLLMTHADSREVAARRAWKIVFARPLDGKVDLVTGAPFFGEALRRLLADAALFMQGRILTVAGDRGAASIEFTADRGAQFGVKGPEFDLGRAINRIRGVEVPKMRPLAALLEKIMQDEEHAT